MMKLSQELFTLSSPGHLERMQTAPPPTIHYKSLRAESHFSLELSVYSLSPKKPMEIPSSQMGYAYLLPEPTLVARGSADSAQTERLQACTMKIWIDSSISPHQCRRRGTSTCSGLSTSSIHSTRSTFLPMPILMDR